MKHINKIIFLYCLVLIGLNNAQETTEAPTTVAAPEKTEGEATTVAESTTKVTPSPTADQVTTESTKKPGEVTTISPHLIQDGYVTEKQEVGTAKIYKINRQPKYIARNDSTNCLRPAIVYIKNNCTCPTPEPCPEIDHLVCEPCPICEQKTIVKTTYYRNNMARNVIVHEDPEFTVETTENNSQNRLLDVVNTQNNRNYLPLTKLYKIYPGLVTFLNENTNNKSDDFNENVSLRSGISSILTAYCVDIFNQIKKHVIIESIYTLGKIDQRNNNYHCEYKYKVYMVDDESNEAVPVTRIKVEKSLKDLHKYSICQDGNFKLQC